MLKIRPIRGNSRTCGAEPETWYFVPEIPDIRKLKTIQVIRGHGFDEWESVTDRGRKVIHLFNPRGNMSVNNAGVVIITKLSSNLFWILTSESMQNVSFAISSCNCAALLLLRIDTLLRDFVFLSLYRKSHFFTIAAMICRFEIPEIHLRLSGARRSANHRRETKRGEPHIALRAMMGQDITAYHSFTTKI